MPIFYLAFYDANTRRLTIKKYDIRTDEAMYDFRRECLQQREFFRKARLTIQADRAEFEQKEPTNHVGIMARTLRAHAFEMAFGLAGTNLVGEPISCEAAAGACREAFQAISSEATANASQAPASRMSQ